MEAALPEPLPTQRSPVAPFQPRPPPPDEATQSARAAPLSASFRVLVSPVFCSQFPDLFSERLFLTPG
jgi:hypothetical protein